MNRFFLALALAGFLASCNPSGTSEPNETKPVEKADNQKALTPLKAPVVAVSNSDKALAFIEAIETKNAEDLSRLITEDMIQHNPELKNGLAGLKTLFPNDQREYSVDVLRVGENDEYAFTHGYYDYQGPRVGMELFRFEDGKIAEHWAVFDSKKGANPGGNSQLDGIQKPESGKAKSHYKTAHKFVFDAYIKQRFDLVEDRVHPDFREHASFVLDGRENIKNSIGFRAKSNVLLKHNEIVEVYGTETFALAVSKGTQNKKDVVIFDLFSFIDGQISEHWEVIDEVPAEGSAMNENGMF